MLSSSGESITVTLQRNKGKIGNWKLYSGTSMLLNSQPLYTGKTIAKLEKALKDIAVEETTKNAAYIICLKQIVKSLDFTGNYISKWYVIDPQNPYKITEDGIGGIKAVTLTLPEGAHKAMIEVGIGFYDPINKNLYPLTKQGALAIGRYMDASLAFKNPDNHMLPSALLIAEKFSCMPPVSLFARMNTYRVRPVYGIGSADFSVVKQEEFFQKLFNELAAKHGIYEVRQWSVSDSVTTVDIEIHKLIVREYVNGIRVIFPEMPGESIKILPVIWMNHGGMILLGENKIARNMKINLDTLYFTDGFTELYNDAAKKLDLLETAKSKPDTVKYMKVAQTMMDLLPKKVKHLLTECGKDRYTWFKEVVSDYCIAKPYRQLNYGAKAYILLDELTRDIL